MLSLVACGGGGGGGDGGDAPPANTPATLGDTVALTASGRLVSFDRAAPGTVNTSVAVAGLRTGETLLGIDTRPADGRLYALGSAGTIYVVDPATGNATQVSTLSATAGDDNPFTSLSGNNFAVDFNPAVDRLRVVSDSGQNLRINVDTGATITDGAINPAGASATAAAYTNSFAGTTSTQLYVLNGAAGRLQLQDPPNDGTLDAGVPLGVTADGANGFDIDARTNTGYAVLQVGNDVALYTINLRATTAAATRVAAIPGVGPLRGIALRAVAAPSVLGLTSGNRLLAFDPRSPNTITSNVAVSGLGAGETLVGIDFRPRDGLLWGLTGAGRLYTIDAGTGVATLRATLTADPADTTLPFTGLSGTVTSVDFNPAADRLRVITSTGQNLRIVVETQTVGGVTVTAGHTTTDLVLNRASGVPSIVASAYTNSFAGTTSTSLFNLEENADQLTLQSPPNDGTLTNVGPLGLDITGRAGFDIAGGSNGLALAALRSGTTGPFSLYSVTLSTGAARLYNNTSGNAAPSQIGGASGPADLVDIAVRL
jgi:hypothetical protein